MTGRPGAAKAAELAREAALEVGFDLVGIAPLRPPAASDRFRAWLEAGRHAGMSWLERQAERILDPGRILEGGRSLVVVGLAHARAPVELEGGGRVARYAAGRDYHNVVGKQLRKLASRLESAGVAGRARRIVDAGPLLERSHAAEAGLGFESKAANLLHPELGPWFFLGELIVDAELEPDGPRERPFPSCGTCRACLDACPTRAIVEPGVVDSRLCISYQTIENRDRVPHDLRDEVASWAFGCDVCSEVCPFGDGAADVSERFGTHPEVEEGTLERWLRVDPAEFPERFRGSPLQRPKRDGLAANAALALAAAPRESGRDALLEALEHDPAERVREAAAWSLGRAHGRDRGVVARLEGARDRAAAGSDERAGIDAALGAAHGAAGER